MRKFFALALVLLCVFSVVSCDDSGNDILEPYFTGRVLEKHEKSCLIEVTDIGNCGFYVGEKLIASTDIKGCPNYSVGDFLKVSFDGKVALSYPGQILSVTNIDLVSEKQENNNLSQPITNLEFWIGENVDNFDFSSFQIKYGMMGGTEYYGSAYTPTLDEYQNQVDPEHCVIYTVTSYPDYSDYAQHITHIYITDPAIEFYGISRNSSFEEFDYIMKNQGFEITRAEEHCHSFEKGSYWVSFTKDYISIGVRVTNKEGIEF